ncbi:hypothetical protein OHA21_21090 [Actinoplanes sp. NBC_00393]|uniref:hypothetical protein n=1 Tax=Actinoplanes sp. NBC_00393 TaxID=2975953 RepID=UPI002E2501C0
MKRLAVGFALLLLAGCTATSEPSGPPSPSPAPARPCGSPVSTAALPEWARAGFSWDGSGTKHVLGDQGEIVAILFGAPLTSPPAEDHSNKILWVSRQPVDTPADLKISAVLDGTEVRADENVAGGPGPSIIDLPQAGCWRLTLTWSGRTDTMDLTYVPKSG